MANFVLPWAGEHPQPHSHEKLNECGLFKTLSADMQEACQRNVQLLEYLHMLPVGEMGVPEYYKEASRKLGDLKHRNLIYPVSADIHIHVLSSDDERDFYIPIEPTVGVDVAAKLALLERELVELAWMFEGAENREEKEAVLVEALKEITIIVAKPVNITMEQVLNDLGEKKKGLFGLFGGGGGKDSHPALKNGKVPVTQRELDAIRYVISRDKIGMGTLEPFIHDNWIEDISCAGLGSCPARWCNNVILAV